MAQAKKRINEARERARGEAEQLEFHKSKSVRLEARLNAIVLAAEQIADEMEDDGDVAIVVSERLRRLLGFARRDKEDLQQGNI